VRLSAGIGLALTALLAGLAVALVDLMGGDGRVGELAVRLGTCAWHFSSLRWALVGAPRQ